MDMRFWIHGVAVVYLGEGNLITCAFNSPMMTFTQLIEILVNFSKNIPFSVPLPGRGHLTVPRLEIGL